MYGYVRIPVQPISFSWPNVYLVTFLFLFIYFFSKNYNGSTRQICNFDFLLRICGSEQSNSMYIRGNKHCDKQCNYYLLNSCCDIHDRRRSKGVAKGGFSPPHVDRVPSSFSYLIVLSS